MKPAHRFVMTFGRVAAGLLCMWISGLVSVELPFANLPVSLQSLAAMVLPFFLPNREAVGVMLLYLVFGALGLPIWAGGVGGFRYLTTDSGGYLVGMLVITWIAGVSKKRLSTVRFVRLFALFVALHLVLSAIGMAWIAVISPGGISFTTHISPFLAGMVVKSAVGAFIVYGYHKSFLKPTNS
ncbi:MAG: biotin transporter BioY [Salibacteraceae bacterium]